MTVAVMVKVFDGIVLAADSATTVPLTDSNGVPRSHQVYNSANKVFHLHRSLPIGAATWGLGAIGSGSIGSLAKDLRARFMGDDQDRQDWKLDPNDYSIEQVAERMTELFFDELYQPLMTGQPPVELGFVIAGFGSGSTDSEVWVLEIRDPALRPTPSKVAGGDDSGWSAYAQSTAMNRLFNGFDADLASALKEKFDPAEVQEVLEKHSTNPVIPPMPFMDAINLAGFMVEVTSGYAKGPSG